MFRSARRQHKITQQLINDFQSESAEIAGAPDPVSARLTLYFVAFMIVTAIALASVTTIDRIVDASGRLVSTAPTIVVQPLDDSIIHSLNVRVGDFVPAGTVLATLDQTFTSADVAQLEQQLGSLECEIARLKAERVEQPFTVQPGASEIYCSLQLALWNQRKAQFKYQIQDFDQKIESMAAAMRRGEADVEHLTARLKLMTEIEQMRASLEKTQSGSRLSFLVASADRIKLSMDLASIGNTIQQNRHDLESLKAAKEVYVNQWRSQIFQDLVTRQNALDTTRELLAKATKRQDLVRLVAPEDAFVLEMAKLSVGSVAKNAEPLYTLVPLNEPLEAEVSINTRDIGFALAGDPATIKFEAYDYLKHGWAKGNVRFISEDAFVPQGSASSFYKARIQLTSTDLRNVPDSFRLIPGMPLSANIKVGSRTVLSYIAHGVLRNLNEGMRDP
jgi:HlyD family type I secretion membrane fusion protein